LKFQNSKSEQKSNRRNVSQRKSRLHWTICSNGKPQTVAGYALEIQTQAAIFYENYINISAVTDDVLRVANKYFLGK
jgi:hypothetical protein